MFDAQAFYVELRKNGLTVPELAKILKISKVTLYRKISGESDFFRSEIQQCRELFGKEAADRIFFATEVA
ncbi:MAG: helix-turn-helix domain-containing protein [Oscillospiraceae bacterium]|nr:helix-turn-helix domain-containing protein [Oscillospiraceae bacterium]